MPATTEQGEHTQYPCPSCSMVWNTPEDAAACCTYECERCGRVYNDEETADECCSWYCDNCGTRYNEQYEALACCRYSCDNCGELHDDRSDARRCCNPNAPKPFSWAEAKELQQPYLFLLDGPRTPRLASIEQELSYGASSVLGAFNALGITDQDYLDDYSSNHNDDETVIVKEDGSLPDEGCEIVYGRWNLSDRNQAETLGLIVSTVRGLRERNLIRSGTSAGVHIHVSARDLSGGCIGPRDIASMHGIVSHLSDLLYRFAAAGWQYHRSYQGNDYARPLAKVDGKKTPTKVRRATQGNRYCQLNFERLFDAVHHCRCGACQMGEWHACTCDTMDNATIEWRIFNSSTKPETLHAWMIAVHAITARAIKADWSGLPENDYTGTYRETKPIRHEKQQVDFLLSCPMSKAEREIVRDALRRSPGITYTG